MIVGYVTSACKRTKNTIHCDKSEKAENGWNGQWGSASWMCICVRCSCLGHDMYASYIFEWYLRVFPPPARSSGSGAVRVCSHVREWWSVLVQVGDAVLNLVGQQPPWGTNGNLVTTNKMNEPLVNSNKVTELDMCATACRNRWDQIANNAYEPNSRRWLVRQPQLVPKGSRVGLFSFSE